MGEEIDFIARRTVLRCKRCGELLSGMGMHEAGREENGMFQVTYFLTGSCDKCRTRTAARIGEVNFQIDNHLA
jgi:hypothetical protein